MILICKDEVTAFSKISEQSFAEFSKIIRETETKVKNLFGNEKFNYFMLMLVDPEVHFHIIPRYSTNKEFEGAIFKDPRWPKSPDLHTLNEIDETTFNKLVKKLKSEF
ncbi:MAG: HIT family protein, partial [Candidatus Portnoybacteria bacterium]|nr:HIT family protein [Candidatus Portnoybacteria bacterium]